jgi:signal transduction histidine kinase
VLVAGPDGRVTALNRAARRMLGTTGDPHGRDYREVLPLVDSAGADWWSFVSPYRGIGNRTGHPERLLELRGSSREFLVTARYVRDRPGGPVQRLVVAFRDTRARRRADRDQADLVSTVAHEIRSPLTTVKGFTSTLLTKWDRLADVQKQAMLAAVNADADRVTRLITELLDIARIDSGRLTVSRQVVDIGRVVARHVAAMAARGEDPERFDVRVADGIPEMWVDADKLDQVLGNLLENAVRHGSGTVTIVVEPAGDGAAVTVTDEGEGIPDEQRDRVFTRFWRSGRRGGTGLGLYIVRGLVEAHGGQIEVGRGPGGGARFRFVLPAATPDFLD